jgi:hypothetical protein
MMICLNSVDDSLTQPDDEVTMYFAADANLTVLVLKGRPENIHQKRKLFANSVIQVERLIQYMFYIRPIYERTTNLMNSGLDRACFILALLVELMESIGIRD